MGQLHRVRCPLLDNSTPAELPVGKTDGAVLRIREGEVES
jgi:hypothetical protein